jgi:hypothetical protein
VLSHHIRHLPDTREDTTDSAPLLHRLDHHLDPMDSTHNEQVHHHDITHDTQVLETPMGIHRELSRPDITPADTTRLLLM